MANLDPVLSWTYFVFLCIISIIALPANTIVLTWKPSSPDDRLSFARLGHLLASQALANLTTAMVVIPLWLFILIMQHKNHSSVKLDELDDICFYSFDVFHGLIAALHLIVIATERACAIGWPIIHRTAPDRVNYIASVLPWLIASSISSIIVVIYYFTKASVLITVTSIMCYGFPVLVICAVFLTIPSKLLRRVLTPSQENDVAISKAMAVVFLLYLVVSSPYHIISLLNLFCAPCELNKLFISLGLRYLFYSSSAVIPVVVISLVPDLRARVHWCCFRFHAINEESRNDLYAMEIPGIQPRNNSCTLVKTAPRKEESAAVQDEIPV